MGYHNVRIVVLDERHGSATNESLTLSERHTIEQADIKIQIKGDGVFTDSNLVDVITPPSDAQMSSDKAKLETAYRESTRKPDPPPRDALHKAYRALGNSEDFEPPPMD